MIGTAVVVSSSGGGSVVLPPNPDITLKSGDTKITATWTVPAPTEVAIRGYNIYISETEPTRLKDMRKVGTTTETSFEITGLTNDQTYWVVVESVSVDGYGNASIAKSSTQTPVPLTFVIAGTAQNTPSVVSGILASSDGKSFYWSETLSTGIYFQSDIVYQFGKYITLPETTQIDPPSGWVRQAYTSSDGFNWMREGSEIPRGYAALRALAGDGEEVLISPSTIDNTVFRSVSSSLIWVKSASIIVPSYVSINKIVYGNGVFLLYQNASSNSKIIYSIDKGASWTLSNQPAVDVTFGNERFIAREMGTARRVYYSFNGIDWVLTSSTIGYEGASCFDGTRFIFSSYPKQLVTTTDGISTNQISTNLPAWAYLSTIAYSSGMYVCVEGRYNSSGAYDSGGFIWYSYDLQTWVRTSGSLPQNAQMETAHSYGRH